ncbi:hypothetical protein GOODEAATRI_026050 [Goodea atripinnis]|uniref:Uncharacterized protein n=1 Tax=Goodea atripinnis TaxID=208336 RepID=A0ABV0P7W0_9TELE
MKATGFVLRPHVLCLDPAEKRDTLCSANELERKAAQVYTGVTHSLLSVAMTSGGALGKQICDPEENALQGEACLINRIVPVWFTLFTGVTLDEAARTEVR